MEGKAYIRKIPLAGNKEQYGHIKIDNVNHGRSRPPSYPINNGNNFSKQSATNNPQVINILPPKKVGIAGSILVREKDFDKEKYKINVTDKCDGSNAKAESSIHLIGQTNSPKDRIGVGKPSNVAISSEILKAVNQLDYFDKNRCRQKEVNPKFSSKPNLDGRGDGNESFSPCKHYTVLVKRAILKFQRGDILKNVAQSESLIIIILDSKVLGIETRGKR